MKKIVSTILIFAFITATGCVPQIVEDQAQLNATNSKRFVQLIDLGQTTREQEQDYIRAQAEAWKAFCEALEVSQP